MRSNGRLRRVFTAEYKAEVMELCRSGGRSMGEVCRDLGLGRRRCGDERKCLAHARIAEDAASQALSRLATLKMLVWRMRASSRPSGVMSVPSKMA